MKKILLGTSALVVAASMAVPASAAEKIKLKVGGYYTALAAIPDVDVAPGDEDRDVVFGSDSEVHFSGKTTLDNGLTIGFKAEMELEDDTTDRIDELWISIGGGFGQFRFGEEDGVAESMLVGQMGPSIEVFADDTDASPVGINDINSGLDFSGDDMKIIYFTPRIAGFQGGVSFTPNPEKSPRGFQDPTFTPAAGEYENAFELAANYEGSFNALDLGASIEYFQADAQLGTEEDLEGIGGGLVLGFGGFSLGGRYSEKTDFADDETETYSVGAGFETGPWAFGVEYAEAETETAGGATSSEFTTVVAAIKYALGPGMTVSLGYVDEEEEVTDADGSGVFTEFGIKF